MSILHVHGHSSTASPPPPSRHHPETTRPPRRMAPQPATPVGIGRVTINDAVSNSQASVAEHDRHDHLDGPDDRVLTDTALVRRMPNILISSASATSGGAEGPSPSRRAGDQSVSDTEEAYVPSLDRFHGRRWSSVSTRGQRHRGAVGPAAPLRELERMTGVRRRCLRRSTSPPTRRRPIFQDTAQLASAKSLDIHRRLQRHDHDLSGDRFVPDASSSGESASGGSTSIIPFVALRWRPIRPRPRWGRATCSPSAARVLGDRDSYANGVDHGRFHLGARGARSSAGVSSSPWPLSPIDHGDDRPLHRRDGRRGDAGRPTARPPASSRPAPVPPAGRPIATSSPTRPEINPLGF